MVALDIITGPILEVLGSSCHLDPVSIARCNSDWRLRATHARAAATAHLSCFPRQLRGYCEGKLEKALKKASLRRLGIASHYKLQDGQHEHVQAGLLQRAQGPLRLTFQRALGP